MTDISLFTIMLGQFSKKDKIPFILFVSTREVGKKGYMSWENIREIEKYDFVEIGNHSHTHDYLIDFEDQEIKNDLVTSIEIFKKSLVKIQFFFLTHLVNIVLI